MKKYGSLGSEKTNPIKANLLSFSVLRSAYRVKVRKRNLKKQSQFARRQIGISSYMKGYYGNILACGARKNKPNQSQYASLRLEILSTKLYILKESKGMFEKTKPICDGMIYRKVFFERILWQYAALRDAKKQSQFKANIIVQCSAFRVQRDFSKTGLKSSRFSQPFRTANGTMRATGFAQPHSTTIRTTSSISL